MMTLAEEAVERFKREYDGLTPSEKYAVEGFLTPAHNLGVSIAREMGALVDHNRDHTYCSWNPGIQFLPSHFLFEDGSRAVSNDQGLMLDT